MNQIMLSEQDEYLRAQNWFITTGGYVRRNYIEDGLKKYQLLHRIVAGVKEGEIVDHINGNPLDNRRENLRLCSHEENMRNRKTHKNSTTHVKGVHPKGRMFYAQIRVDGKKHHLGSFSSIDEAKNAYVSAAIRLHGNFARLS